jgi:hypothetical protein
MTVRAKNSEIGRNIIEDRCSFSQAGHLSEVMRFNEALANRSISLGKIETASLTPRSMMLLGSTSSCGITFYPSMLPILSLLQ